MNADIYITGSEPWRDRFALEDEVEQWLRGRGEIISGGSGKHGWDINIEFGAARVPEKVVRDLLELLRRCGAPADSQVSVVEHKRREYRLE